MIEVKWRDSSARSRELTPQDIQEVQRIHLEAMRKNKADQFLDMKDANESVTRVGTDPHLAEATRQRLADLWKTYTSIRNDYVSPLGPLEEYSARCRRNQVALEELTSSLRVILGVE